MHGPLVPETPGKARPYVIVVGNEKGGTGKSTTAMHLIVALMRVGYKIGSIDLDERQGTLTRYIANRRAYAEASGRPLPMPEHRHIERTAAKTKADSEVRDRASLQQAFQDLISCNFVVIDTPGSDSYLSHLAHQNADTLVTPLNDSFVDIDMLARIDRDRREVLAPSPYSKMVWENNNRRVVAGRPPVDWIVMRNRLTHIESRNKREIAGLMVQLAQRIGFRVAPGFGERVIFRELFLKGLTVLDNEAGDPDLPPNPSHESARSEINTLLEAIGLAQPAQA
jgi:chromosome partitioning protein